MQIEPFKLERFFSKHEFTAKHLLCSSDSETMSIQDILDFDPAKAKALAALKLGYTQTQGDPELRHTISSLYKSVGPDGILTHAGAQEAIFLTAHALLVKSDHVIAQTPCYQSYVSVPESMGCKVSRWEMEYKDDQWGVNIDALESMITPATKLLIINSPHNPTCYTFKEAELDRIIQLARKHNLILLSDEVYMGLEHAPHVYAKPVCDMYENGISLHGMSKGYGFPGLRIGWLASQNKSLLEKIWIFKEYTSICNSAPSEFLANLALQHGPEILARNLGIVQSNMPLLDVFFQKHADTFSWPKPEAGVTAFVRLRKTEDDLAFVHRFLESKNVLLLPGVIYERAGFFRIGFGKKSMPIALALFDEFLDQR